MELRKHLSFKYIAVVVYFVCFAAYIIIGLQPAEAAKSYAVSGRLNIPEIGLVSDVTTVELEDGTLPTPDTIVGSFTRATNKTFLFGHQSTVFKDLDKIELEDTIIYNNKTYKVYKTETLPTNEIKMNKLLKSEKTDTIVIMTCAGEDLGNKNSTHRLIIWAS
ncbi:sortase [Candidatus Saccharibacteria bacterium]|nr:sortase [Candidatus Saccharibacteria bacterium]